MGTHEHGTGMSFYHDDDNVYIYSRGFKRPYPVISQYEITNRNDGSSECYNSISVFQYFMPCSPGILEYYKHF